MATPAVNKAARTEAGYDSIAAEYAVKASIRSPEAQAFASRYIELLPDSSLVLDLGCGPGEDLNYFASAGHWPIGLDRSSMALSLAQGFPRIRGDLRSLPFPDASVHAVWAYASLLHVDASEVEATLSEWTRVLRPKGIIGFSTSLGGDSGWELAPAAAARMPTMPSGEQRWFVHHTERRLSDALQLGDFELIETSVRSSHRDWLQVIARTQKHL